MNALTVFPSNENPDCVCFVSVQACSYADIMVCDDMQCIFSLDVLFCFFSTILYGLVSIAKYVLFNEILNFFCNIIWLEMFVRHYILWFVVLARSPSIISPKHLYYYEYLFSKLQS